MLISTNSNENPTCLVCSHQGGPWLGDHLAEVHGMTVASYLARHPDAPTASEPLVVAFAASQRKRRKAAALNQPTISFAGIDFPVNMSVPADVCLPLPEGYEVPRYGDLSGDVEDVILALSRGRSAWVWGPPGTGKDAVFSAWSALTRTPGLLFTVVQGADIASWRFTRAFNAEGTYWEEGLLLKALRDGYTAPDGTKHPYLIVLSDFDRATRAQAEELRQILDSIQGRVTGPSGEVWPVFPGTRIVATANSVGAGDLSGRCISSNQIDASILDRFERKYRFHAMDIRDEDPIVRAKVPVLASRFPEAVSVMMRATQSIRQAVDKEEIYVEWSHRTVVAWATAAEDLVESGSNLKADRIVAKSARVVLDGLPDEDTREKVKRLIDPLLRGGMVGEGDTSHIGEQISF